MQDREAAIISIERLSNNGVMSCLGDGYRQIAMKISYANGVKPPNHLSKNMAMAIIYRYAGLPIPKKKKSKGKPSNKFYKTGQWLRLRYMALSKSCGKCQLCGRSSKDGIQLHVDHIKPRSLYPHLELSLNNLQVLCSDCNLGKSNIDETDWR